MILKIIRNFQGHHKMQSSKKELTIKPFTLETHGLKSNALIFVPQNPSDKIAVFSHGYTSHKASILNWNTALLEKNIPSIVFDLPGHFLGGYYPLPSFEDFSEYTHLLFSQALEYYFSQYQAQRENTQITIGGHSLGGLFALKALNTLSNKYSNSQAIGVGLGLDLKEKHIYTTKLFSRTLEIRNGYVDPLINTDRVFPWIKEQKKSLNLEGKNIHLICGKDDLIVGKDGLQNLASLLAPKNNITYDEPEKLPHHLPELAAKLIARRIFSES